MGEHLLHFRQQNCWTLATGEFPIGESFLCEIRKHQEFFGVAILLHAFTDRR